MSMGYTRTYGANGIVVWQGTDDDIQLVQGGFLLVDPVLPLDATGAPAVIPAGTPVVYDEVARTASVLSTGKLNTVAGGSDVAYKVNKGHTFKVGQNFSTGATGGKAYPITAIDTSNSAYDLITVGTSIGAAAVGDTLYASTATGGTASALPAINGLLYADTFAGPGVDISVVAVGTIYARRVPYSAAIAAALPKIIYSQSK